MEELAREIIRLKEEKEIKDKIIEEAKKVSDELGNKINALEAQLFLEVSKTDEFKAKHKFDKEICENIFITSMSKATTGYTDEEAVLKYLKENGYASFIKTTESIKKKELNSELKNNSELKDKLNSMTSTKVTEWVTVTKADNHARMLEHMSGK